MSSKKKKKQHADNASAQEKEVVKEIPYEEVANSQDHTEDVVVEVRKEEPSSKPVGILIFAVLCFLFVLASLFFGVYHIIKRTDSNLIAQTPSSNSFSFSNLFNRGESMNLSVDTINLSPGEETLLNVDHRNRTSGGVYSLAFPCDLGIELEVNSERMTCDEQYIVGETFSDVSLKMISSRDRYTDFSLALRYETEEGSRESSVLITAINRDIQQTHQSDTIAQEDTVQTTPPARQEGASTGHTKAPAQQATAPAQETQQTKPIMRTQEAPKVTKRRTPPREPQGRQAPERRIVRDTNISLKTSPRGSHEWYSHRQEAQLEIGLKEVGIISENGFRPTRTVGINDRAAVVFVVTNHGGERSGSWSFDADIPVRGEGSYYSGIQDSLRPGESVEFTLAFNNIDDRRNYAEVFINLSSRNSHRGSDSLRAVFNFR